MGGSSPIRIAVIGVGAMGQAHCKMIVERIPELHLAAVVDTHEETVRRIGSQFDVPAFTSVDELLATKCADAALVVVPHPLHLAAAEPCMRAGLHVLCEKPLADTVSAADRMIAAARENGVVFGVMFQRRYEPVFAAAMEFARSGAIGRILRTLLIVPEYRTQRYFDSNPWRATWKGEGGGVLINQAPHLLDIFLRITGLPVSLRGQTETRLHHIEVEDHAEATLRYRDGGTGYLYCSTNEHGDGEAMEVIGDQGKLIYRERKLQCHRYAESLAQFTQHSEDVWGKPVAEPVMVTDKPCKPDHYHVMRNFARHILYGETLHCDGSTGLPSLELANAITLSSHLGEEITLPISREAYDAHLRRLRESSTYAKRLVSVERVTDPKFT